METREEIDRLQLKLGFVGLGFVNYNFSKNITVNFKLCQIGELLDTITENNGFEDIIKFKC